MNKIIIFTSTLGYYAGKSIVGGFLMGATKHSETTNIIPGSNEITFSDPILKKPRVIEILDENNEIITSNLQVTFLYESSIYKIVIASDEAITGIIINVIAWD